ncbi:MAG: 50S ribosomal protein L29 [Candidatus Gastranaerophilales bacterium]|nr:50S ribosomal protein L29 [Candidatus Gastranaerophilales bacterium]
MKLQDIREKTVDELKSLVVDLKKELFNLRLQKSTNKLENPASISVTKRTIARAKTVMNEKTANAEKSEVENA